MWFIIFLSLGLIHVSSVSAAATGTRTTSTNRVIAGPLPSEAERAYGQARSVQFNAAPSMYASWTVDTAMARIRFAVLAETAYVRRHHQRQRLAWLLTCTVGCSGYVALGISDNGGMKGADIWIIRQTSVESGEWEVRDSFSTAFSVPALDRHPNVDLLIAERNATHTLAVFERDLITCDDADFDIGLSPVTMIWAIGDTDQLYRHSARGQSLQYLLVTEPVVAAGDATSSHVMDVVTAGGYDAVPSASAASGGGYIVPAIETSYVCSYHVVPADRKYHITAWEQWSNQTTAAGVPISLSSSTVHHMQAYACPKRDTGIVDSTPFSCTGAMPTDCSVYVSSSVGVGKLSLPANVGLSMGGSASDCAAQSSNCVHLLLLEVHHNNPSLTAGIRDYSGVRIWYSSQLRENEMGELAISPPAQDIVLPAGALSVEIVGGCPSECTAKFPTAITVFGFVPHMHYSGVEQWVQHIRGGEELAEIAHRRYYDFNHQSPVFMQMQVLPGDRLIVHCRYDVSSRTVDTRAGLSSTDEMCTAYLGYYPRVPHISTCVDSPTTGGIAFCGTDLRSSRFDDISLWNESSLVASDASESYTALEDRNPVSLCRMALSDAIPNPHIWLSYSPAALIGFVALYLCCKVIHRVLVSHTPLQALCCGSKRWSAVIRAGYADLEHRTKHNVQCYVLNVVIGSISLVFVCRGLAAGLPSNDYPTTDQFKEFMFGCGIIGSLYAFELGYRQRVHWALIIHHSGACAILALLMIVLYDTMNAQDAAQGFLFILHANTEQPIFLALIARRLVPDWRYGSAFFKWAAVWNLISKTAIVTCQLVLYVSMIRNDQTYEFTWSAHRPYLSGYRYLLPVLVIGLFIVQLWVQNVLFMIAGRPPRTRSGAAAQTATESLVATENATRAAGAAGAAAPATAAASQVYGGSDGEPVLEAGHRVRIRACCCEPFVLNRLPVVWSQYISCNRVAVCVFAPFFVVYAVLNVLVFGVADLVYWGVCCQSGPDTGSCSYRFVSIQPAADADGSHLELKYDSLPRKPPAAVVMERWESSDVIIDGTDQLCRVLFCIAAGPNGTVSAPSIDSDRCCDPAECQRFCGPTICPPLATPAPGRRVFGSDAAHAVRSARSVDAHTAIELAPTTKQASSQTEEIQISILSAAGTVTGMADVPTFS